MNAENIKTLYDAVLDINGEPVTFQKRIDTFENSLNDTLNHIADSEIRLKIDSLIGYLMINSEYKGFELGIRSCVKIVEV